MEHRKRKNQIVKREFNVIILLTSSSFFKLLLTSKLKNSEYK